MQMHNEWTNPHLFVWRYVFTMDTEIITMTAKSGTEPTVPQSHLRYLYCNQNKPRCWFGLDSDAFPPPLCKLSSSELPVFSATAQYQTRKYHWRGSTAIILIIVTVKHRRNGTVMPKWEKVRSSRKRPIQISTLKERRRSPRKMLLGTQSLMLVTKSKGPDKWGNCVMLPDCCSIPTQIHTWLDKLSHDESGDLVLV